MPWSNITCTVQTIVCAIILRELKLSLCSLLLSTASLSSQSNICISLGWFSHHNCVVQQCHKLFHLSWDEFELESESKDTPSSSYVVSLCSWESIRRTLRLKDGTDRGWMMRNSTVWQKLLNYNKNETDTKNRYYFSSLVPRLSITANAVEGLVKLLRTLTSSRCLEAWHFRWTAVLAW